MSSHQRMAKRSWFSRIGGFVFAQLLALAVFVGFPAFLTAVAPVSWVLFERDDGQVAATAKTCLLFLVPYKTTRAHAVTHIGDRFVAGTVSRERRNGRSQETRSEDQGFLVIQGNGAPAEVAVSPHDIESVIRRAEEFLHDPQAKELKLFVVANWKFSVIAGGLASLLTLLYVAILAFGILLKLVHFLQWALGIPPERLLFAKHLKANSDVRP